VSDAQLRAAANRYPVPVFDSTAFTAAPPLHDAIVAIVTTAGLRHPDQPDWGFETEDPSFRVLDGTTRSLVLSNTSQNFDRTGFVTDINVVFPIDRLKEMADEGVIRAVSPRHVSFVGNLGETMSTIRLDSGPAAAQLLRENDVNVVLLTPV
jgi:D-proline reductase (dithiol) PrdB